MNTHVLLCIDTYECLLIIHVNHLTKFVYMIFIMKPNILLSVFTDLLTWAYGKYKKLIINIKKLRAKAGLKLVIFNNLYDKIQHTFRQTIRSFSMLIK